MYYNKNGKKEHSENFLMGGFSENFGTADSKKWMYWLIVALVVITIILVVLWFIKKNKGKSSMGYKFW
jgi:uncharacterized membrane protein